MQQIEFYRANEKPYGVFSNLYKRAIIFDGVEYPTSEHAYQAGKPRKDSVREWLMAAPSPSLLAMAAHGLYVWDVHPDWSKTKFERMKRVLHAKFTQHLDLQEILLSTGDARLVEVGQPTLGRSKRRWQEYAWNVTYGSPQRDPSFARVVWRQEKEGTSTKIKQ
jgi:ribA/ribD-fused uncharacterized protein